MEVLLAELKRDTLRTHFGINSRVAFFLRVFFVYILEAEV